MAASFLRLLRPNHSTIAERMLIWRYASGSGSKENIDKLIKGQKVVVFMKGVPSAPKCGFSNAIVQVLKMHGVEDYASFNVLQDDGLRKGIKEYSNWPTVPQVYMNGEFIGGCDIIVDMHKNGDLVEELDKIGIKSKLLDAATTIDG